MLGLIGGVLLVAAVLYAWATRPSRQAMRPGYLVRRPDNSEQSKWTNVRRA